jgi:adenosylcobinamide-GDP ribazoletransferase
MMIDNFFNAVRFLTIFPVKAKEPAENDIVKSMVYFPLVGFFIGFILVYADKALLWVLPHPVVNALLLVMLVMMTRALHIDGLGDTFDGLMGGTDRESRLRIMKDSRLGTAGALAIFFSLFVKYLALNGLFSIEKAAALLSAPILARWSHTLMVYQAQYGREQGTGKVFVGHLRMSGLIAATAIAVGLVGWIDEWSAVYLVLTVVVLTLICRKYLVSKLGGITGDAIGAVSEINETAVLLLFVILSGGK